jgi:hypothetical protein
MNDIKFESLEKLVVEIRGKKVLLDSDVAALYGVETKRVNEAVKNNPEKFPEGYIIYLDKIEWMLLKSKFSTSMNKGGKVKPPSAFTEKGLYMLATILKGEQAVQATLLIIETFTKIRELSRNINSLSVERDQNEQKSLMQKGGEIIADILGDELMPSDSETSFEVNFAVLKFKHTVKRKKSSK